ncbi:Biotin-requiring enzyme [Devosia crocina]|uniref:Biotin-requiring enzyme n=1 Tax=Devosia crocina TaxID=429728 RepID=A0A1I7MZN1_9HYPH|nr:acetyl-CoA carboxylase biotin carboxyl carrier protein subunit [Devosia crocina]SFV27890.1 Biotin-requiring enzyme [Devosia crocina]
MITIADLDRALSLMQEHGLETLRVREGEALLSLTLSGSETAPLAPRSEATVTTKGLGRLLLTHPQHSDPLVQPGDAVAAGATVGFLENGSVLLPVVAGKAGTVGTILASEGALLGYGAPVLTILVEA